MKKIIFCISLLLLFSQPETKAQDNNEILNMLLENTKNKYLKDFKTPLASEGMERFSVVLSKNDMYEISSFPVNDITFHLYDKKGNTLVSPLNTNVSKNRIVAKKYKFSESGVYHLEIKNNTDKKINTTLLLALEEKDDKEEEEVIAFTAKKQEKKKQSTPVEDELFFVVEEMPEFHYKEDGVTFTDFNDYIKHEHRYPSEAKEHKIEGRVIVQFTINKNGYVKDAKVMRGLHPALDQEALRIIYSSPRWKPGKQRGHKVNVIQTFPVVFKLNNQ